TEFTYRSHAHVLLENFLEPYLFNGKLTSSGMDVVSFYVDQFPDRDMAREVAAKYNIKIYRTIAGALCLGGEKLAVDGVLSIGEHGKYPINEKGQQEYPRKRFFDEIVAVFRDSGRVAHASARDRIRPPIQGGSAAPFVHHGILVNYRDGLRAIVLGVSTGGGIKWHFGCRISGEPRPVATSFYVGPWQNRNLFKALAHAIQTHFRERHAPYPVERTLLTTGVLAAAMDSRFEGGRAVDTPHLNVAYKARDFRKFREMGASWRILTVDVPQPKGIERKGEALK